MEYFICTKCLTREYEQGFCQVCGRELQAWGLKCECGETLRPAFWFTPFGGTPLYKNCSHCGREIKAEMKKYVKLIRLADRIKRRSKQ